MDWAPQTMTHPALIGAVNSGAIKPTVQVGMLLEIAEPNNPANSEVVQVTALVGANGFQANFVNSHAASTPANPVNIILRGNPGPQANYNPHKDNNVVLHLSVIK